MTQAGPRRVRVLLVEDNPAHADLVRETLDEMGSGIDLDVADDGVKATEYLRDPARQGAAGAPDLVILDLNLPKKNGREVLQDIKGDPRLRHIPVVVLTTSDADEDIRQCYDLQAACYLVKPFDLDEFMELMRSLESFWTGHVRFPTRAAEPFVRK